MTLDTSIVPTQQGKIAVFAPSHVWFQGATVVKIPPPGIFHAQLLVVTRAESLSVAARTDVRVAPHHAHFLVIPAEGIDLRPETSVEMGVIDEQTLRGRIIQLAFHRR